MTDFTPYSGQQQNWPTQPGSFVNTSYAVPAYISSYPNRSYNVIGCLDATTAPIRRSFSNCQADLPGEWSRIDRARAVQTDIV